MASFTSCTSALTAALAAPFGCGIGAAGLAGIIWEPSDTVFSFTYDPGDDCEEDDDGRTICWIIAPDGGACTVGGLGGAEACEPELFSEVSFGDATLTANSISVSTEKEKKKLFTIGPIPFEVVGKISGTLGIKASLGIFFREFDDDDPTSNNESFAGVIASVGPFASVDLAAEGAAILGLFRIGIEGSITLISVDLLPTVELGIAQRLREDGECWMKNTGRVEFTGPATLELASGSVGIAAYFGIKDFCFLGWCEDLSVKIFSFTIFSWDAPFTRTWNLWHVVEEFGSGDGLCPFGDIPPMDWRSPVGCTSWTGADAYCPGSGTTNGLAVHVYEPSFSTYRETFYAGASGCATLVVNGNVWPNSMEAPAGAWRDALVVNARPLTTRRYHYATTALEGNKYYDANFRQFNDYTGWFHNPSGYATTIPEQPKEASAQGCFLRNSVWPSYGCVGTTNGPWSGQFTDTRIRICSRLIDVHLRTFGVAPGVAIRLETDEGREREIFSDTKWQVSHVTNATGDRNPVNNSGQRVWSQFHEQMNWDGWVSPQNYVFPGGYAAAPWYSGTPPAPFSNDGSKMNWMSGWRTEGLDPNSVVNGYTYYRRVFIADAELYDLHARCDNRCDIYLDGQLIHTTGDWNQPSNITVTTVPGRMHLLGVALYNADAVKGVGAFTLGMKAR